MGKINKKGLEMKKAFKEEMKKKRKELKVQKKEKRAKLIVKNLPFKVNEKKLRAHFGQYGEIDSVNILKKDDKLVGCAFVQFKLVQKAAKARHHLNGKPFLDRNIEVDFALSKEKYQKEKKKPEIEVKDEPNDIIDLSIVKEEDDVNFIEPKQEDESEEKVKDGMRDDQDSDFESSSSEDGSEDSEDSHSSIDAKHEDNSDLTKDTVLKKPHIISNDVSEGKTVFIKNLPFTATNEDLKECISQFGPLFYALVCIDRLTEHSKGTGFVKFKNQEDAEKCLQAGTELKLMGNILDCHKAIDKNAIQKKQMEKTKTVEKDSRNLYLLKEGLILAGTTAAKGVSANDMAKRLQLEQHKTQMLRRLNMFVSKTRLVMHNIPPHWNDKKLTDLLKKHVDKNSLQSVKIMRDMNVLDSQGVGKSKEFAFISFTDHEHALTALRSLNNNPNVFLSGKRPIVSFSIDNVSVLKTKENRLQKSQLNNPNSKLYNPNYKTRNGDMEQTTNKFNQRHSNMHKGNQGKRKAFNFNKQETNDTKVVGQTDVHKKFKGINSKNDSKFVGIAAMPGPKKMRSRFNLKRQAQIHHETLKKEKKMKKSKTLSEQKRPRERKTKKKPNKQHDDEFQVMVNQYKNNLINAPVIQRNKWYS